MAQGAAKKIKPRKKSVLKRIRQTEQRTIVNRANLTRVRGMMKSLRAVISAGDAVNILFVGADAERKGGDLLLTAFRTLQAELTDRSAADAGCACA